MPTRAAGGTKDAGGGRRRANGSRRPSAVPVKEVAVVSVEAQKNWRDKDREAGIIQVNVRVLEKHAERFKEFGALLRDGKKPLAAFKRVWPKAYESALRKALQSPEGGAGGAETAGRTETGNGGEGGR